MTPAASSRGAWRRASLIVAPAIIGVAALIPSMASTPTRCRAGPEVALVAARRSVDRGARPGRRDGPDARRRRGVARHGHGDLGVDARHRPALADPDVGPRQQGAGADRAAGPRSPGGDGRALERRRAARRSERRGELCEPRAVQHARPSAGDVGRPSPRRRDRRRGARQGGEPVAAPPRSRHAATPSSSRPRCCGSTAIGAAPTS